MTTYYVGHTTLTAQAGAATAPSVSSGGPLGLARPRATLCLLANGSRLLGPQLNTLSPSACYNIHVVYQMTGNIAHRSGRGSGSRQRPLRNPRATLCLLASGSRPLGPQPNKLSSLTCYKLCNTASHEYVIQRVLQHCRTCP
jgi:hypothetical protein